MNEIEDSGKRDICCPICESGEVSIRDAIEAFQYGDGDEAVQLAAHVTVRHCLGCESDFLLSDVDDARHDAVCRHLGVLSSTNIRRIRESHCLTREGFASLGGFGVASVGRWERGALIQSQSSDNLIFLLRFRDNVERLRQRKFGSQGASPLIPEKFSAIRDIERSLAASRGFCLRA